MYIASNKKKFVAVAVVVGAGVALAVHRKSGGKARRLRCTVKVFRNSLRFGVWLARTSLCLADWHKS